MQKGNLKPSESPDGINSFNFELFTLKFPGIAKGYGTVKNKFVKCFMNLNNVTQNMSKGYSWAIYIKLWHCIILQHHCDDIKVLMNMVAVWHLSYLYTNRNCPCLYQN